MNALRVGGCLAAVTIAALAASLPSCGGGGAPTTQSTLPPATTTPPPPTTTLPPTGGGPTIDVRTIPSNPSGKEPLVVSFDLGRSQGSGILTYHADFDGDGNLQQQGGPNFTHTYKSDGVTVRRTQLVVRDASGRQAERTVNVKSWVDVSLTVKKDTGCAGTLDATANLKVNGFGDVHASRQIDAVIFKAFTVSGNTPLGSRPGSSSNPTTWKSGVWNVHNTTKVRVIVEVSSPDGTSEEIEEDTRPAC